VPDPTDDPIIYTKVGNLPESALTFECHWEDTPDYTVCRPTWYLNGELVKQSAHVLSRKSIFSDAVAGRIGG
jgi:hypothetical protein